jgi:hypothetical protein
MSKLTVCPCCGAKFEGEFGDGCVECGARAVGPPLARPERELPSYGHAFVIFAAGALLSLSLAAATVAALVRSEMFLPGASALLRAAETAAWSLKWSVLPAAFALALACIRLYSRMRRERSRFVGHGWARAGLALTVGVAVSLAALVGVTVPERLRMRELGRRAAENAVLYETDLALMRYRQRFGTYPATLEDLRRLEDPDGSVARLLARIEAGEYKPETDVASLSSARARSRGRRRVSALRGSSSAPDLPDAGITLTNYEVVLPGRDGVLGTDDDLRIRDGVIGRDAPATAKARATPTVFVKRSD